MTRRAPCPPPARRVTPASCHILAQEMKKPRLTEHLLNNLFFDTCVYLPPGIDPEAGHYYDDTKRYIEAADLTAEERLQIYEGNTRRVYPRLDATLKAQGR